MAVGDPLFIVVDVACGSLLVPEGELFSWVAPYADKQHVRAIRSNEDAKCRCMIREKYTTRVTSLNEIEFQRGY